MPEINQVLQDPDFLKLSGKDQVAILKQLRGDTTPTQGEPYQSSATGGFVETARPSDSDPMAAKKSFMQVARPSLEMGGMTVGAVTGVAAGSPTGPGAALTGVAGGTLGYGIGVNIADRLEEFLGITEPAGLKEAVIKTSKDLREGATYELGGQVGSAAIVGGGKGVVWAARKAGLGRFFSRMKEMFPKMSDKGMILKAKDILKSVREESAQTAKTAKETQLVKGRLGIKTEPTYAQKTGSIKAASYEQSASAKNNELKEILMGRDAQINKEALEQIDEIFASGGNIDDVMKAVESRTAKLTKTAETAKGAVANDVAKLSSGKGVQETGIGMSETLTALKQAAKDEVSGLYNKIPKGIELNAGTLKATVKNVAADFKKIGGGSKSYPSDIVRQIKRYLKPSKGKSITFDGLRDLRSQIGEEIRESMMGLTPNLKLARRLKMLESGIDDSLDQMLKLSGKQADASTLYREASAQYKLYHDKFKKGVVGEVLQSGQQASGKKIAYSDIPLRFFRAGKMDAADDLVRAVGKEKAAQSIDDFANMEMALRVEKGTKASTAWLQKNKEVLNKYGLYNKYADIVKRQEVSDQAVAKLNDYSKTVASKIIGVDVENVIKNIFGGGGKTKSLQTAKELLQLPGIKGNPAAIRGIQTAFKDFFLKEIKLSGIDVLGNPLNSINKAGKILDSYAQAMKVIYKDNPKQMQSLFDYHKLLRILARNKNVTYAGGSTTAEKIADSGTQTIRSIGRNVAQLIAVQKGKGWFFSSLKNLWSAIAGAPARWSEAQTEKLLTEAIYNPEVAETIMMATKSNVKKEIVQKRWRHHIIALGLYKADTKNRNER